MGNKIGGVLVIPIPVTDVPLLVPIPPTELPLPTLVPVPPVVPVDVPSLPPVVPTLVPPPTVGVPVPAPNVPLVDAVSKVVAIVEDAAVVEVSDIALGAPLGKVLLIVLLGALLTTGLPLVPIKILVPNGTEPTETTGTPP
jgi:hypothetical protein